eukprot:TRINITY_DN777_c0_g1_i4.p1 TRINITY_DN777_c0_g1~~TRINITY_DN777_c0_g1_i4.p1  ORF type:complete len:216 (-),score=25.83 TRINITY_DN777_c0_g1_i4:114-761(-)
MAQQQPQQQVMVQQQPVMVQQTMVAAVGGWNPPIIPNQFSTGLCDCCNPGCCTCCYGCCCTSCAYGDLAAMFTPVDDLCCTGNKCGACSVHYLSGACLTTLIFLVTCAYVPFLTFQSLVSHGARGAIRQKFDLHDGGDKCGDCVVHWFCDPCAIIQETKEMNLRLAMQRPAGVVLIAPQAVCAPQQPVAYAQPDAQQGTMKGEEPHHPVDVQHRM